MEGKTVHLVLETLFFILNLVDLRLGTNILRIIDCFTFPLYKLLRAVLLDVVCWICFFAQF